jgi:two-component system response regulator RegA
MATAVAEQPQCHNTTERIDILVVDDDEIFGRVLSRSLTRRGLRFSIVQNSRAALDAATDLRPQRIVLDLNIGGENGLALIEPLTQAVPDCRIVLLTGYASVDTAIEAIKRGATHYLAKPVDTDEILAAFEATGPRETLPPVDGHVSLERAERDLIQHTLEINHFNISATARALGMHRRTLQRKLAK